MNKVYRIVWNARTNTWTAVQENAKAKGKSSSGRVSAEPATLGGLGLKSSRFVCTALASALMMTAGYANAGPGIFINDGDDGGCIVTSDESARRNALFFLTNNNLEWAAGQVSGGSMPSANAFRNKCSPGDAASQTNRALFHGDAGGAGSKHLSLGGRLDVNSGIIGLGDRAAGNNSIRIGSGNTLQAANSQSNSVAIGNDVETKAAMAVAIGPTAKANGQQSVAVGNSVEASGNFGVAIGTSARANAPQTVALGNNANAAGEDALAIGRSAHAQAKDSIAFGRSSQAAATGVAIGSQASAAVANSVALGSGTTSVAATDQSGTKNVNGLNYTYVGNSANSSVAVGNRQIKQVGAGEVSAASTDAVNGSQLYATQNVIGNIGKGVATNLGGGAALKPDGTFTAPTYNLTDANGNAVSKNNVGDALNVLNSRLGTVGGGFQVAAATGATQTVKPGNTLKFIDGTNTTTEVSTDGAGVTTVKINATGGSGAAVPLTSNPATGQVNAPAAADANKAVTAGSVATAINTAVGKSGFNVEGGSVAGGTATGTATSRVNNNDTVKLQAGKNIALAQNGKEFTFGTVEDMEVTSIKAGTAGTNAKLDRDGLTITSSGNPVKLTNNGLNNGDHTIVGVAAGTVNATSTEAVNGSQLHKTANSTATHLGGGSAIQSDGSISAPTYSLTDSTGATVTKNNVGDALDVLNSRMNTVGTPVALNSNPSTGQVAAPTAADANKAATAGSVATAVNNAVSALESKGLQIDADSGTVNTVALGETVKYAGDANIKTKVTDNQIGFSLADNLNVTSITTGDSKLDTDGLTITGGPSVTKTGINAGGKTITNVTAGTISATSTDAATGGQVYGALNNVKNVLGSNVSIDGSGNLSGNNIGGTGKTTFSDAIAAAYDKANSAAAGWKFQVNGAAEQTIEPTNTVKFLNGRNIELSNNGKDITVATKADLTADSLTINNGPVINGSGINTNGKNIDMGNSGKITNLTSGNVAAGDSSAVTGDKVNTAINDAVNGLKDAGFKIAADSGTDDTVKLGETVKYAGDANIKTTVTDNQIGFSLADNLNVTSITTGDSKLDTDGLTITGGPSVTKTGINAGGKTITNVAAGTVSATSTDAATGGQVYGALNNVKNVLGSNVSIDGSGNLSGNNIGGTGKTTFSDAIAAAYSKADAANAGWKFQVNSGAAETIRPNDTVGFKDGTNIAITNNGKDITIATNPNLTADSLTINGNGPVINGNGINTNGKNIDMGSNGKITNLADGSIAAGSKDAITGGQLHTALNNISNAATNLIGTTQPDIVTYDVSGNKADNTNNVKQAIDKMNNGGIKFFHVNDGTGTQNTAGTQPATEDSSASGRYGAAVGYQAKASGESGVAIGKGAQATAKNTISIGTGNIVSGEGSGAIGDPTTITGAGTYTIGNNNGTVSANDAGAFGNDNTLTGHNSRIIGNHNIVNTENTFVVGNNVSRATANSVVLGNNSSAERVHTTATTPGSNYTFGGLNDANVAGVNNVVGVVSVGQGAAGSDASVETRQIQNVAAGVVSATSTDAINGSQLYHTNQAILNGVNGNLANLGARIGQVEDAANAGTAAAMAMAGLPQAYLPGKSMMAVGGSVYRGESGYAIGYSTISDGGNWIIKGTATGNSRGHYGATAAVGYQW